MAINFFPKKYQDNKVGETKCLNFLLLLAMLFLFKFKLYLDKNRISCLIFVGIFKFLTSLWCPVDSFYELKYSSNDEFFTIEILQLMDKINLFETKFDNVIYSIHTKKFVYQPPLSSLILLLSGDIELNPGPIQGANNPWSPFDNKGFIFFI